MKNIHKFFIFGFVFFMMSTIHAMDGYQQNMDRRTSSYDAMIKINKKRWKTMSIEERREELAGRKDVYSAVERSLPIISGQKETYQRVKTNLEIHRQVTCALERTLPRDRRGQI